MPSISNEIFKNKTDEWLTPPEIIKALGTFDLDPCAPVNRPWDMAKKHYCLPNEDGLLLPWDGRVWLNPPYGQELDKWLSRMALHNYGTVLVFARTETRTFFRYVWPFAHSILFLKGRISFYKTNGKIAKQPSGAPSVLIAYGSMDGDKLKTSNINGKYIRL